MKKLLLAVMALSVLAWPTLAGAMSPDEFFNLVNGKTEEEVFRLHDKLSGTRIEWEGIVQFVRMKPSIKDRFFCSLEVKPYIFVGVILPIKAKKSVVISGWYTVTGTIDLFGNLDNKQGVSVFLKNAQLCVGPINKP